MSRLAITLVVLVVAFHLCAFSAGVCGLTLLGKGTVSASYALVSYMCFSAVGAGLVLALTSKAYVGAGLQSIPSAIALIALFRSYSAERQRPMRVEMGADRSRLGSDLR